MAPENVVPVVQLPESSDEFGDSRDINPAAAASAANRVAEFVSASEEVLSTQLYEELGSDDNWAIVQSGAPSNIARTEQGGGGDWRAYTIPSDFADAEQDEGDAWRNHMAVGGQIEEGLPESWIFFRRCTTTPVM